MKNILEEVMSKLSDKDFTFNDVKCAELVMPNDGHYKYFRLKVDFNLDKLEEFKSSIKHISYDDWYGSQKLYWYIWMNDWTWFSREEYDWAENWALNYAPDLPKELI